VAKAFALSEREVRVIVSLTPEAADRVVTLLMRATVLLSNLLGLTRNQAYRDAVITTIADLKLLVKRIEGAPRHRLPMGED
jgi:hypothetical protein